MSDEVKRNPKLWRMIPLDQDVSRSLSDNFKIKFLESVVRTDPDNIGLLVQLGDLYSKHGQVKKSLGVDLNLVKLCPEEKIFHYNLACSYSILKQLDASIFALEKAFLLGYDDVQHLQNDPDLSNVRSDKRFQRLMKAHFNKEPQV